MADRALELAAGFLEGSRAEIEQMIDSDGKVLFEAAQLVREEAETGPHAVHSVEHLAFSLIAAAHEHLREQAAPPRPGQGTA